MHTHTRRVTTLILLCAVGMPLISCLPASAGAAKEAGELAKYMNPFQKKGYLNQSQDRVIKKKSFKVEAGSAAQSVTNRELGFFAIIPADKLSDQSFIEQQLSNSKVNGVSVMFPWSMIQPAEDKFNWQPIDDVLSACEKHKKTAILRFTTCGTDLKTGDKQALSDTPKWVLDAGVKSVNYTAADGIVRTMPLFWDKTYLAQWSNFVSELADRYDKNTNIHSIGITGGGFAGGTAVVPTGDNSTATGTGKAGDLAEVLKQEHGMNQKQIVDHWKYTADVFPKKFSNARLNFNINPPAKGRWAEDALDQIADYLVFRYGGRVYITRFANKEGKHGFDDYRLLLKFRHDTLSGLRLPDDINTQEMPRVAKFALDDGVSYAELPVSLLNNSDQNVQTALDNLAAHIGYQLVAQQASVSQRVGAGQALKANFTFINNGAATAMRPERNMDKDSAMSYRVQVEVRDVEGKPVLQNIHTPETPTSRWEPGKPVTWETELKMIDGDKRQLAPGDYAVFMSLIDPAQKRKLQFLRSGADGKSLAADTVEIGKLTITAAVADTKIESASDAKAQDKQQ